MRGGPARRWYAAPVAGKSGLTRASKGRWALLGLVFLGAALSAPATRAAQDSPGAFLRELRPEIARGDTRAARKSVASQPGAAYGAIAELLGSGVPADRRIAKTLAALYREAVGDDRPLRWVEAHERLSEADRAEYREANVLRKASEDDRELGRFDASREKLRRCIETAERLRDAYLEGRCAGALGGVESLAQNAKESLRQLDRAIGTVDRTGDRVLSAGIAISRGWSFLDLGRPEESKRSMQESVRLHQELRDVEGEGVALNALGAVCVALGSLEEAIQTERAAIAAARRAGDPQTEIAARNNLARAYQMREKPNEARRVLEVAVTRAREAGYAFAELEALRTQIVLLHDLQDRAGARVRLERARALAAGMESPLHVGRVEILAALLAEEEGDHAGAIALVERALPNIRSAQAPLSESDALSIQAGAHYNLGNYKDAIAAQTAAVEAARTAGRNDAVAEYQTQLGNMLVSMGDVPRGLDALEESVAIRKSLGDEAASCQALAVVGQIRLNAGQREQGRTEIARALACIDLDSYGQAWADATLSLLEDEVPAPPERASGILLDLDRVRAAYARINDLQGQERAALLETQVQLDRKDPAGARSGLRRIDRLGRDRLPPTHAWVYHYLDGRIWLAQGDRGRALRACERSVASIEKLRGRAPDETVRAALVESRMEPYRELVRLRIESGDAARAYRTARLAKARTFSDRFATPRAGFLNPLATGEPAPTAELQSLLRPGEVLLDFFFLEKETVAFVVRAGALSVRSILLSSVRLAELAELARYPGRPGASDAGITQAWRSAVARLGDALLAPLAGDLETATRVLVAPTGALDDVPFGALELGGVPLTDRWIVAVLPSAEVLRERARTPVASRAMVAFGDPDAGERGGRLPGAAREARLAAQSGGPDALLALGGEATETAFRNSAPTARTIHLAAHGHLDLREPWSSRIDLTADRDSDGRLTAEEIAGMKLSASLVVLGGCATGRDAALVLSNGAGDERAGLVRAFLAAGAGAVIASLWELDDDASASILPSIHLRLRERDDPAAALARVQADLREGRLRGEDGARLDHPFYWAALTAYGAGR